MATAPSKLVYQSTSMEIARPTKSADIVIPAPGFGVKTEAARRGAESSKFIMQVESPFDNDMYIILISRFIKIHKCSE